MAQRRMMSKKIIDTDLFLSLPPTAQNLYFHLLLRADDDGFVGNPKMIMKMVNAAEDDIKLLIIKRLVIPFESGIILIKHWRIHNCIQKDRYQETQYTLEKSQVELTQNGEYVLTDCTANNSIKCIQNGNKMYTQVSIGKDSIDKDSIDINNNNNINKQIKKKQRKRATDEEIKEFFDNIEKQPFFKEWQEELFPQYDLKHEAKLLKEWLFSNPQKKRSNLRRTFYNWLTWGKARIEGIKQQREGKNEGNEKRSLGRIKPDNGKYDDIPEMVA